MENIEARIKKLKKKRAKLQQHKNFVYNLKIYCEI